MTEGGPLAIEVAEPQLGFLVVIDLIMQTFCNMTPSGVGLLTVRKGVSDVGGSRNAIHSQYL
jgi:hypothetical protein